MKKLLGVLLCSFFVINEAAFVRAEETTNPTALTSEQKKSVPKDLQAEIEWRRRVSELKAQRTALMVLGIGGATVGVAFIANGIKQTKDAEETPGCYRDESIIYCKEQAQADKANNKLDQGQASLLTGSVVITAGAGMMVWGILRGVKANRLSRYGKTQGYSFDLLPQRDGMTLVMQKSF